MYRIGLWISFGVIAGMLAGCGEIGTHSDVHLPTAGKSVGRLNGAGSSFVNVMMQKWASEYRKQTGTEINYQSIGSGGGIQKLMDKTVDFGCSDAPLDDKQLAKAREAGGDVVHIPLCMGGVVPIYKLKSVAEELRFTGPVLAGIFLGQIKKWNDPALAALNPGVALPDQDIAVVHRSDGSGTSFIWTDYLSKVSPEWKDKVGKGTSVNWPSGVGQKGNEGVAGHVGRTEGAMGYVGLIYALKNQIAFGSVQNAAGQFVKPTLESVTAAASATDIPPDLRYSLTNAPGKDAYPIAGTVWALVYVQQPAAKGKALLEFLTWVTHEGQKLTKELDYAPLPPKVVKLLEPKLSEIQAAQ